MTSGPKGSATGKSSCYNHLRNRLALMANKPPFAQGAQVEHGKFGLGSVLSANDDYIVIKFDDHGEKKFVTSIVLPALKRAIGSHRGEKTRQPKESRGPGGGEPNQRREDWRCSLPWQQLRSRRLVRFRGILRQAAVFLWHDSTSLGS